MALSADIYRESFIEDVSITRASDTAITVDEAKDWARIDDTFDDSIVDMLIESAQRAFEEYTRTLLYESTVTVTYSFDKGGDVEFRLPYGPVDSITHVQVDGSDIDYELVGDWIEISDHDADDVEIEYVAKTYDPADSVDAKIKVGLLKWVATNYDDRENTVIENVVRELPNGSKQQWSSFRRMLL